MFWIQENVSLSFDTPSIRYGHAFWDTHQSTWSYWLRYQHSRLELRSVEVPQSLHYQMGWQSCWWPVCLCSRGSAATRTSDLERAPWYAARETRKFTGRYSDGNHKYLQQQQNSKECSLRGAETVIFVLWVWWCPNHSLRTPSDLVANHSESFRRLGQECSQAVDVYASTIFSQCNSCYIISIISRKGE